MRRVLLVVALMFVAVPLASAMTWLASAAPVLNGTPGNMSPIEATGPTTSAPAYTAPTATDDPDGDLPVTCSPVPGDLLPLGVTTVNCSATDSEAQTTTESFTITVADTTPPVLTPPSPVPVEATSPGGTAATYDPPSASDVVDSSLTITCSPASGAAVYSVGSNNVHCSATDDSGNTGVADFTMTITDTTDPVLGAAPANQTLEATSSSGAVASFTAPSATDNGDAAPSVSCALNSGSTFPIATTTVNCLASDASGNTTDAPVSFTITVRDTTAPQLTLPANIQVEADSPSGKVVTYSASASDAVAGSPAVTCAPVSGSTFPVGTTPVNCSASDPPATNTANGSFTVTVTDNSGPTFTGVSADLHREANGPGGSVVTFPTPTATDTVDGPIAGVSCLPGSGSTFPIGTTLVTCSASDSHGNPGAASFNVIVADTTPPTLVVPAARSVYATTPTGIPDIVAGVFSFLNGASATDIVDAHPVVSENAPSFIPVGTHTVIFTAIDFSGNGVSREVTLIVLPQPPEGTPPLPIPPGTQAPANIRNLTAVSLNGAIRLRWQTPAGVDHVVVTRFVAGSGQVVYSGSAATYLDRGLQNGTEYRYVVASVDAAGNSSAGVAVVAVPRRNLLRSPKDGARLRKPPRLMWAADAEADYFNAQLLQNGRKILSVWPVKPSFQLKKSWRFQGRKYTLKPGLYHWYVWPGFGARSAVDYGELVGTRTFRIVR